jgi:hypothetical protein
MSSKKPTAKLITKSSDVTKPLESFMASIGIRDNVELYMYNSHVYVNINAILPVLSVDANTFKKKSEAPIHYIIIKNTMYVSKYGLVGILGSSREAVALNFIDYLFEIIYKLEKNGSVSINDIDSRSELIKIIGELNLYKAAESQTTTYVSSIEKELEQCRAELEAVECENKQLALANNTLEDQLVDIQERYAIVQDAAKKLAVHAKLTGKSTTKKQSLLTALSNADEEISSEIAHAEDAIDSDDDLSDIKSQALLAEKQLSTKILKSSKLSETSDKTRYYILQSTTKYYDNDRYVYKWQITNTIPVIANSIMDFKEHSADYRLGGIKTSLEYIWFVDIIANNTIFKMLNTIFNTVVFLDEEQVVKLIH